MSRKSLKALALVAGLTSLALPAGAAARGGGGDGGGGGGGGTTTPPAASVCASIDALNSGVIDKIGSRKPITLDFQVANCGTSTLTVATTLVGTSSTLRSADPFVLETHVTDPYSAQQLTLKPRESRTISAAARIPTCGCSLWGIDNGYNVTYDVTLTNVAGGAVLDTTTSGVNHTGGV
jgi:hypothetical protein